MKILRIISALFLSIFFVGCTDSDELVDSDITGTYIGELIQDVSLKSSATKSENFATVVVTAQGDQIQVHCVSDNFDERIILDTYHDDEIIRVCLTGEEFQNTYGHHLGMMNMHENGHHSQENEWMRHLHEEHEDGDEHFGFFDMRYRSCDFTFVTDHGNFHFHGTKE